MQTFEDAVRKVLNMQEEMDRMILEHYQPRSAIFHEEQMRTQQIETQFGPTADARSHWEQWVRNLQDYDPLAVAGTCINLSLNRTREARGGYATRSFTQWRAVSVRGHRIIRTVITPDRVDNDVLFAYSPLLKNSIGRPFRVMAAGDPEWLIDMAPKWQPPMDTIAAVPDPVSDEQSRRAVFAHLLGGHLAGIAMDAKVGRLSHENERHPLAIADRALGRRFTDTVLALVALIKNHPSHRAVMDAFDRWGPPEGPVGEALIHIDRFRSE